MTFPLALIRANLRVIASMVFVALIIAVTAFFVGYEFSKTKRVIPLQNQSHQELAQCKQRAAAAEIDLDDCINNKASTISMETNISYDFGEIGISSSLFTPTAILEREHFLYKKQNIYRTSYDVDAELLEVWRWEDSSPSNNLFDPQLKDYLPLFRGFGAYEYGGEPYFLSTLAQQWKTTDSYTNDEGLIFYYWYDEGVYGVINVHLQSYIPLNVTGNPLFVIARVGGGEYCGFGKRNCKGILSAKARLKEMVKDISIQKRTN